MTAPGNSRSIFLITGPDNGEKFLVGSSRIRTFAPLKLILKRSTFAFCPPDNSRIGCSISSGVYLSEPRYDCYQFVIKRLIEIAETRINTGFFKQLDLFKLDCRRGFACHVVAHSAYALDFIDYTRRHSGEQVIREASVLRSHKVGG